VLSLRAAIIIRYKRTRSATGGEAEGTDGDEATLFKPDQIFIRVVSLKAFSTEILELFSDVLS
jgi:hypothetical protein